MSWLPPGGWTITCSGADCAQTTAEQAPAPRWRMDEDRAVLAARALGWIHHRDAHGEVAWYCPMHQAWNPAARQWQPAPLAQATRLARRRRTA